VVTKTTQNYISAMIFKPAIPTRRNCDTICFGLGLTITFILCASADAATMRRSKPPAGPVRPVQHVTVPNGYAVPGWTDEETRKWLYNGSAASGLG
jgi:hypothetical protein